MDWIDLRSDTVTLPTPEMREAMAHAELGDDVYGEDPTVNRLQSMAAELLGKEAALFVPSGTMGNLTSVLSHCGRGDEVIIGNLSHTFLKEVGGVAALGGVHPYPIPNEPDGTFSLDSVAEAIRSDNPHHPISRLIVIENTHNFCGGVPLSSEYTRQLGDFSRERGLRIHIDGARIFNAAVAIGVPPSKLVAPADSVMFCLSKGLCAPVGSMICGSLEFIRRAHRVRKSLGGGMRQAGILAAAGIIALETMVDRLAEDHRRALRLAEGLGEISEAILRVEKPATNMVFIQLMQKAPIDSTELVSVLSNENIKVSPAGAQGMRLVMHYWVDDQDTERVIDSFNHALMGD
jgi:threonine aldolase